MFEPSARGKMGIVQRIMTNNLQLPNNLPLPFMIFSDVPINVIFQ